MDSHLSTRRPLVLGFLVAVLCAAGLAVPPTASAATGDGGTISGHLTRADGKAAAGVSVWALHYIVGEHDPYTEFANVTALSDANGDYTLDLPDDGTYVVYYAGYNGTPRTSFIPEFYDDVSSAHDAVRLTVSDGVAIDDIDADLVSQSTEYVTFEGKVTNPAGNGIGEVLVRLYCASDNPGAWIECMETTTRADGSYSLEELSRGDYRLGFFEPTEVYEYEYYNDAPHIWHGNTITSTTIGETKQIPTVTLAKEAVERVVGPSVTGKAAVGRTLTVDPGTWSVPDPQFSYQWFTIDGNKPIPGATSRSYVPTAADEGDELWAEVTVRSPGLRYFVDATALTDPVTEADPEKVVENLEPPVLSGTPAVGKRITVTAGEWSPTGVSLGYQWLRNGNPISGATSDGYRPKAGDVDDALSVRVTGTKAGHTSATSTTEPVTVQPGTIANNTVPSVSGRHRVGRTLTADSGVWAPRSVDVSFQWLRDGLPIVKATGGRYTVKKADKGHRISVLVTAAKRGYTSVSMSSSSKKVR